MTSPSSTPIQQTRVDPEVTLTLKAVMINGRWVRAPYLLTKGPEGLSDKPAFERIDK
jgi:hypothetical protein